VCKATADSEAWERGAALVAADSMAVAADSTAVAEGGTNLMTFRLYTVYTALAFACAVPSIAQERFDTPEAAAQAVINAADAHDSARLAAIFGPGAKDILTSGAATQDLAEQTEFAHLAREKHRLEISPMNPGRAVLAIGDEDWPFPVPIVRTNGKWSFDASETPVEMHARRIGTHELDAIEICHAYVEAQQKYASEDRDKDGMLEYAPRLMSAPGRQDGLYWEGASEPLVPAAFAQAAWEGAQKGNAKPYHGYYFRVLEGQGSHASGGPHNYFVKNKLIGGFGLVAWPAEYGVTGIHTFIVNQNGVVYEKDIAPVPGKPAQPITRFDPDDSWRPVD
jgi:hypothetical protein